MSDFTPKKVFILVNGEYEELPFKEFKRRKAIDPAYEDRRFIAVNGYLMETDQEQYTQFYRTKEREKREKKWYTYSLFT